MPVIDEAAAAAAPVRRAAGPERRVREPGDGALQAGLPRRVERDHHRVGLTAGGGAVEALDEAPAILLRVLGVRVAPNEDVGVSPEAPRRQVDRGALDPGWIVQQRDWGDAAPPR